MPTCHHIYYETCGDKSAPAIMLLHGFLGNGQEWNEIRATLETKYFCITPDLPGHGQSLFLTDSEYTMPETAKALLAILKQEEISCSALVGYSMGGRLALYMALTNPAVFDKLILESASPGLKTEEERQARVESDSKVIARLNDLPISEFITTWYSQPLLDSIKQDSQKFEKLVFERSKNNPGALTNSLKFMGTGAQPSLWDELPNLKPPTLLIVGANDNKFNLIAAEMSQQSESISVATIENAGHNVHYERPQEYIEELQKFLK